MNWVMVNLPWIWPSVCLWLLLVLLVVPRLVRRIRPRGREIQRKEASATLRAPGPDNPNATECDPTTCPTRAMGGCPRPTTGGRR
ncbi:MAG TPA: hypothetical protein PLE19_12825 [Planctomycetota bacterium]|nr:hypothetical protein [Planctomycetota bacterium]HRR82921.1 hypothetical protein [Planctomycetota bacterium]HRT95775.1 hypothetical protein [Planctomycetota bacterium]